MQTKLHELQILIIDAVSMVGSDLFCTLDCRLREVKGVNVLFGGVTVLAFGDLFQLAPVGQRFVFQEVTDEYSRLAGSIWKDHFKIVELIEVMRQRDDQNFAKILNRLREGHHTEEDIYVFKDHVASPEDQTYSIPMMHPMYLALMRRLTATTR